MQRRAELGLCWEHALALSYNDRLSSPSPMRFYLGRRSAHPFRQTDPLGVETTGLAGFT